MVTIRIVGSFHKEMETISHKDLFKILKAISPDIIFEELDKKSFDVIYREQKAFTLEPKAILQYLKTVSIPHVPVDTYFLSDKDVYDYEEVVKIIDKYNPEYKILAQNQLQMTLNGGFRFINSIDNNIVIDSLQQIEVDALKKINNVNYFNMYKKWQDITILREKTFIKNIVSYYASYNFKNAVFITGAEHKYSLEKNMNLNNEYPDIKWLFGLDEHLEERL